MDLKSRIARTGRLFLDLLLPQKESNKALDRLTASALTTSSPSQRTTPENALALLDYRDAHVQSLIKTLKYHGRRESATLLGEVLYAHLLEELADREMYENFTDPVLVPVPLAPARLRERGFNQVEWILNAVAQFDNTLEIQRLSLLRTKHTDSQTKQKSKEHRKANLSGAFCVKRPELIKGRNIVLIDDVVTTGATLSEARKTLLQGGAKNVLCIALAH